MYGFLFVRLLTIVLAMERFKSGTHSYYFIVHFPYFLLFRFLKQNEKKKINLRFNNDFIIHIVQKNNCATHKKINKIKTQS